MYLGQETTKWDGRGQLYGFLNGRIALRIKDVVREEYNKPQQERMYLSSIDNLQAEDQKGHKLKKKRWIHQLKLVIENNIET